MRWISLDLAAVAGFAVWEKTSLLCAGTVYRHTKRKTEERPWAVEGESPAEWPNEPTNFVEHFPTERACWEWIARNYAPKILVVEDVRGKFHSANISLAETRGTILAYMDIDRNDKNRYVKMNASSWRSQIKHLIVKTDFSEAGKWPGKEDNKAVAIDIVYRGFGIEVNHNAADAVCLGLSYLGMTKC